MSPHRPENDETLEALAHRLRRLPPPAIPAGLEERLLAGVPPRSRARRVRGWLAAAVLLAPAACLLFALPVPRPVEIEPASVGVHVPNPAPTLWTYEQALRRPNASALAVLDQTGATFTWPVAGPSPVLRSERSAAPLD